MPCFWYPIKQPNPNRSWRTLGINAKLILNGALRYTPIDATASLAAQESVYNETPFTEHLPTYWRADFGVNYSWYKKRVVHALSLNIQNITNRENIFSQIEFYRGSDGTIVRRQGTQLPLIPILSYRIEF